uniref:Uncharacterized protein n=1 Tax=Meloidogyne enterolobii TaxID=390850 RepID=A0A6V7U6H0_MELEN|nr:unnamed protein product [Meloidogyne enterolobii]
MQLLNINWITLILIIKKKLTNFCLITLCTIDEFNVCLSSYKMKSTQNDIMLFPIFDELPFKFDKKINSENVVSLFFSIILNYVKFNDILRFSGNNSSIKDYFHFYSL